MTTLRWPDDARPPSFIIAGAMKCGTTSLHHALNTHPRIFIAERELFFFDVDDIGQHQHFRTRRGWQSIDFDRDFARLLPWYLAQFSDAGPDQVIGEDTTTYLASTEAPARIAALLPDVRLIVTLRDPVDRAYSHYWHQVRGRRVFVDFETVLGTEPGTLLQRGRYQRQLTQLYAHIAPDRVHIVIFEELLADTAAVLRGVTDYLGLLPLPEPSLDHRNATGRLRAPRLQLMAGRVLAGRLGASSDHPAFGPDGRLATPADDGERLARRLARKVLEVDAPYPPMRADTRRWLIDLYRRENAGLGELIGRHDLDRWWRSWSPSESRPS